MTGRRKSVVLADDHTVLREGLKAVMAELDPDIDVVGEAATGKELLDVAQDTPADVYLVDISMPVMGGLEATRRLLKRDPKTRVIILTMYNDKTLVEQAVKVGARGYVLKDSPTEEIIKAIDEVYHGRYYFSPSISGYLVHGFLYGNPENAETTLTDRQREILKLICDGYTEKDIGEALNISYHTVHVHKNNIMKSLDIHSKAELIKYAVKNKIIQL